MVWARLPALKLSTLARGSPAETLGAGVARATVLVHDGAAEDLVLAWRVPPCGLACARWEWCSHLLQTFALNSVYARVVPV